jgi:CBS domain-containing protein
MEPWIIPGERYYYGWYAGAGRQDLPHNRPDSAIKADIVERLRQNPLTVKCTLRVDVKQAVVILQGDVTTRIAKRSAGDDCWDTLGVADVSNQLSVAGDVDEAALRARDVMTPTPNVLRVDATLFDAATLMADSSIGDVIVVDDTGRPVGIVTDRDVAVRGVAAGLPPSAALGGLMGATLHHVAPDVFLGEIVQMMTVHSIRRIPVVEDGHLIGIVTLGDLARHRDPGSALAAISAAEPNLA